MCGCVSGCMSWWVYSWMGVRLIACVLVGLHLDGCECMWVHELVGFCFDGWGYFSGCVCPLVHNKILGEGWWVHSLMGVFMSAVVSMGVEWGVHCWRCAGVSIV